MTAEIRLPASAGLLVLALAGLGQVLASAPLRAQADFSLSDEAVMPAGTVEASVMLTSNPGATAMQVDVLFDPTRLTAGAPSGGGGLVDHLLSSAEPQAGLLRLVIYSPSNSPLPIGEVARVPFTAAATPGPTPLDPTAAEAATQAAASVLPLTLSSGSVHVFTLQADLAAQLGADASLVANGDPLAYTLVASNAGPDAMTSAQLSDPAPAGLSAVTWSCVAAGGATCTAAGTGDIVDTLDLPVGGTSTYTLSGTVSTGSTFIDNLADLEAPDEVFDPDTADNSDSVSVDVCVVDNEVLTDWDIGGVAVFNACVTLTAGPDFNIQPTGDVTLRALGSVILVGVFSVEGDGRLKIETP